MAKYQVIHEPYARFSMCGTKTSRFEADSDVEALIKVNDNCMYSYEDADGYGYGDDEFTMPSKDFMIERIESMNGDGCDYILKIENIDTGEILFESEDYTAEDVDW